MVSRRFVVRYFSHYLMLFNLWYANLCTFAVIVFLIAEAAATEIQNPGPPREISGPWSKNIHGPLPPVLTID